MSGPSWAAIVIAAATLAWMGWRETSLRRRLRTVSAVLAAFREGDFSVRARPRFLWGASLGDVLTEVNQLGDVLRSHRLGEMEAWSLLRKVMSEVDVIVLAVDDAGRVRLANDAAARLLGRPSRDLIGQQAGALALGELLEGTAPRIVSRILGEAAGTDIPHGGPWELRRGAFRLSGQPQTLLVLSDVSRALRDNEREAWRRLIRVIGHEINNSLSPIGSIAESLLRVVEAEQRAPDWETDVKDGLAVVARRAEALARFMAAYATLARLPEPRRGPVDVAALVRKTASLETRLAVEVIAGPEVVLSADADQLEQALINLVKNAADASLGSDRAGQGGVRVRWSVDDAWVTIAVDDDGQGVSETANLFVPFFTTKPDGSGIGLVLSRQIVEAHDGQLSLATRESGHGATARVLLPRA